MKHCSLCNVDVDTARDFCPLCHNAMDDVSEKTTPEEFPKYKIVGPERSLKNFILKIFLVLSVVIVSACVFINIQTKTIPWSVAVAFVVVYLWVLIAHTIISKSSAFNKVFFELSAISAFLISVNLLFSSTPWFTNFVFPALAMLTTGFLSILQLAKKKKEWVFSFFCIYLLLMIVSAIFLIFKIDGYKLLNTINLIYQLIIIFAYVLFGGKRILSQASRKFHI